MPHDAPITSVTARGYRIPTEDGPEADGTFTWDSTHLSVIEVTAGGQTGLGYSYGATAVPRLVADSFAPLLIGADALAGPALYDAMRAALRNSGLPGVGATALSAVDAALWDLRARLFGLPLVTLLGARRNAVPIYGSAGFSNWSDARTLGQFRDLMEEFDCRAVKMKVGRDLQQATARIAALRDTFPDLELMIDANGALTRKPALVLAERAAALGVTWFEEPVSSDDLAGLRLLRDRAPPGIEIAAGEYAFTPGDALRLLDAGAVDVLQLDATRICGISGFLTAAALAEVHHVPLSAHTAPALHLAPCCSVAGMRHVEWFHDHARIEAMLFDGAPRPAGGTIAPDLSSPGHGLIFKHADAERFAV